MATRKTQREIKIKQKTFQQARTLLKQNLIEKLQIQSKPQRKDIPQQMTTHSKDRERHSEREQTQGGSKPHRHSQHPLVESGKVKPKQGPTEAYLHTRHIHNALPNRDGTPKTIQKLDRATGGRGVSTDVVLPHMNTKETKIKIGPCHPKVKSKSWVTQI
ncbi:hypothetical protein ATANTOWER_023904 [Ataeniobius toweri]|uniref:Uncharacterized protein n=1 Tax=Ataeniobius toweri TaxID=208326 RepID=A0ABU7AIR2_9TELE|nr:hypothetical protein [Ataeniobius toweri]